MSTDRELPPGTRSGWRVWLSLLLTLALLAVVVDAVGGARPVLGALAGAHAGWVSFAFACACASVAMTAQRWRQVLAAMGHGIGYRDALYAVMAVWPLSVASPSRAGDLLRPLMVRDRVPLLAGAGSVLAEKAIDVFTLLLVAGVCAASYRLWDQCAVAALLLVAESIVIALLFRARQRLLTIRFFARRSDQIEALYGAFDRLLTRPLALLSVGFSSLTIRLLTVAMVAALLRAVGAEVGFLALVAPWLLATLAGLVPLTLAGMGTRDAAFVILLQRSTERSIPEPAILAATVGYSLIAIWSFALLGLPLLARATWKQKPS